MIVNDLLQPISIGRISEGSTSFPSDRPSRSSVGDVGLSPHPSLESVCALEPATSIGSSGCDSGNTYALLRNTITLWTARCSSLERRITKLEATLAESNRALENQRRLTDEEKEESKRLRAHLDSIQQPSSYSRPANSGRGRAQLPRANLCGPPPIQRHASNTSRSDSAAGFYGDGGGTRWEKR